MKEKWRCGRRFECRASPDFTEYSIAETKEMTLDIRGRRRGVGAMTAAAPRRRLASTGVSLYRERSPDTSYFGDFRHSLVVRVPEVEHTATFHDISAARCSPFI